MLYFQLTETYDVDRSELLRKSIVGFCHCFLNGNGRFPLLCLICLIAIKVLLLLYSDFVN